MDAPDSVPLDENQDASARDAAAEKPSGPKPLRDQPKAARAKKMSCSVAALAALVALIVGVLSLVQALKEFPEAARSTWEQARATYGYVATWGYRKGVQRAVEEKMVRYRLTGAARTAGKLAEWGRQLQTRRPVEWADDLVMAEIEATRNADREAFERTGAMLEILLDKKVWSPIYARPDQRQAHARLCLAACARHTVGGDPQWTVRETKQLIDKIEKHGKQDSRDDQRVNMLAWLYRAQAVALLDPSEVEFTDGTSAGETRLDVERGVGKMLDKVRRDTRDDTQGQDSLLACATDLLEAEVLRDAGRYCSAEALAKRVGRRLDEMASKLSNGRSPDELIYRRWTCAHYVREARTLVAHCKVMRNRCFRRLCLDLLRLRQECLAVGDVYHAASVDFLTGVILHKTGEREAALLHYHNALDVYKRISDGWASIPVLNLRAQLRVQQALEFEKEADQFRDTRKDKSAQEAAATAIKCWRLAMQDVAELSRIANSGPYPFSKALAAHHRGRMQHYRGCCRAAEEELVDVPPEFKRMRHDQWETYSTYLLALGRSALADQIVAKAAKLSDRVQDVSDESERSALRSDAQKLFTRAHEFREQALSGFEGAETANDRSKEERGLEGHGFSMAIHNTWGALLMKMAKRKEPGMDYSQEERHDFAGRAVEHFRATLREHGTFERELRLDDITEAERESFYNQPDMARQKAETSIKELRRLLASLR